jgi:hypothetical protein
MKAELKESRLKPFLRYNLDILFVGLNPATGSSDNGHYFSVNQSLWSQLYNSGLLKKNLDKSNADNIVFGANFHNYKNWEFGITDLITEYAESNSRKIKPTLKDFQNLENTIKTYVPLTVVILHGKVLRGFFRYLNLSVPKSNTGYLGKLFRDTPTTFFNIAFPHGNSICSNQKVVQYKLVKHYVKSHILSFTSKQLIPQHNR